VALNITLKAISGSEQWIEHVALHKTTFWSIGNQIYRTLKGRSREH